ncbi:MAG: gp436 family protein [Candidatus Binataceae bacterium]
MSYATSNDVIARYPNRDLVQLTNEDPTQTAINIAPLEQALNDASAEIDMYLESRFALPLGDPPAVLNRLACDIAMYRLQSLRPLHDLADARQRYNDALQMLLRVAAGEVTLGLSGDSVEPPQARDAVMTEVGDGTSGGPPARMFSRNSLKGY